VPTTHRGFVDLLASHLFADRAARDIAAYFAEPNDSDDLYTGRHFERIDGGGDRPERAHPITAEDLVAVQTLSVTIRPETSVQLMEGHLGLAVNRHLRDIPATMSLLDAEAGDHLADGSPADQCWRLLASDAVPGVGATTAGKLLARKRPRLIAVYDDVLRCALGHPSDFWTSLHHALVDIPTSSPLSPRSAPTRHGMCPRSGSSMLLCGWHTNGSTRPDASRDHSKGIWTTDGVASRGVV
jgi:hypothetical protein